MNIKKYKVLDTALFLFCLVMSLALIFHQTHGACTELMKRGEHIYAELDAVTQS